MKKDNKIVVKPSVNSNVQGKGIVFDPSKIKLVPINDIEPNNYNPKDKDTPEYLTILNEIREKGMRALVYVRHTKMVNRTQLYEIADGEQRWTACKQLGYEVIPVYDWGDMSMQEAQEMTLGFQVQVPFNEIKLAHLLADMVKRYGDGIQVPYSAEQIKNYLDMAGFDWNSYQGEELRLENEDDQVDMEVDADFLPVIKEFIIQNEPSTKGKKKHLIITGVTKYKILKDAIKIVKAAVEDCMLSNDVNDEGRALELICAQFLSSSEKTHDKDESLSDYIPGEVVSEDSEDSKLN